MIKVYTMEPNCTRLRHTRMKREKYKKSTDIYNTKKCNISTTYITTKRLKIH